MNTQINYTNVDRIVFTAANLINIIVVIIFLSRAKALSHPLVLAWAVFIILLIITVVPKIKTERASWEIAIPLLFSAFLILELMLDYVLKLDFRNTRFIIQYLLMYC